jgi:hypothetical protein
LKHALLARCVWWASGWIIALATGCAPSEFVTVTGDVTWNGTAVTDGEVIFTPENVPLPPSAGKLMDGKFEFLCRPGKMRVDIQAMRKTGKRHPVHGYEITELYIPARYNTESELTAEVTRDGENHFTFNLTK